MLSANSWKLLLSSAIAIVIATSSSAKDILLTVLEDSTGNKTVHYQEAQDCFSFLSVWKKNSKSGVPTILTFESPQLRGQVIDAYCVESDGRIWDAEGYSYKRISK